MISLLALVYVPPAPVVRRPFRSRALAMGTQVITDIDDTIKSSGGVAIPLGDEAQIYLGGVDTSYTRNAFYPGVFQFGLEIARADAPPSGVPEKMAILTARAEEFKFALEIKQSSKLCVRFRQAGEGVGTPDWGVGPVLYGSVAEWICQERKGLRKYENFKLLRAAAAPGSPSLVDASARSTLDQVIVHRARPSPFHRSLHPESGASCTPSPNPRRAVARSSAQSTPQSAFGTGS